MRNVPKQTFQQRVDLAFDELRVRHLAREKYRAWVADRNQPQPEPRILTGPTGAPIPAVLVKDNPIAQQILTSKASATNFTADVIDAWRSEIQSRRDQQHGYDTSLAGVNSVQEDRFIRVERERVEAAKRLLLAGHDSLSVAIATGLEESEVEELYGQRPAARESFDPRDLAIGAVRR